jgi:hypothetical protein
MMVEMSAPEADASPQTYPGWVNLKLQLQNNGPVVDVCLLEAMRISELTEHLAAAFCLPEKGADGQPAVYRLDNSRKGNCCDPAKTLADEIEGEADPELAIVSAASTNPAP